MKKIMIVVVLAVLGFSQQTNAQEINFGVKAGLNVANLNGGDADRNSITSFHAGFISEIKLSERFAIQPEILYSRQGSEIPDLLKVKLDYIAIPVMLKFFPVKNFSIEVGPQASFLIEDKGELIGSSEPDADTDASNFDFGANVGFGYDITSHVFTQARYNFGITTVGENPDIKNGVFQLSLGYKF